MQKDIYCKVIKVIKRLIRVATLRKGIYGAVGKCNRFQKGVLIDEASTVGYCNYFGAGVKVTASEIGNYCSIAPNVTIGPGEHPIDMVSTSVRVMEKAGYRIDLTQKDVSIGNDVWIGANAVILRGVKIGNGAVIAAGAIVKNDVKDFEIVGGVPARTIRFRFTEKQQELVDNSRWSEMENIVQAALIVDKVQALFVSEVVADEKE